MKKYIVEFFGTLLLSFVVFGSGNYLAIGTALAIAVLLGGTISGGAFNPAIAFGMMVGKKLSQKDFILYTIFQVLGGFAGFWLSKTIL